MARPACAALRKKIGVANDQEPHFTTSLEEKKSLLKNNIQLVSASFTRDKHLLFRRLTLEEDASNQTMGEGTGRMKVAL